MAKKVENLVFVGLNGKVVALDRQSGKIRWRWQATKSGGYMTLLPEGDRLIVSAGGYIYCLDPATGEELWDNPLTGFGVGAGPRCGCGGRRGGIVRPGMTGGSAWLRLISLGLPTATYPGISGFFPLLAGTNCMRSHSIGTRLDGVRQAPCPRSAFLFRDHVCRAWQSRD